MTPQELANRHMPGGERVPWRRLSWEHYAKLWVHLGIRRVSNADISYFEDTDGTEIDHSIVERFVTAISKTVQILLCAIVLTGGEVVGHGAAGEPQTAHRNTLTARGEAIEAHETPGGAYFAAVRKDTVRTQPDEARDTSGFSAHPALSRLQSAQRVSPVADHLRFLSMRENL